MVINVLLPLSLVFIMFSLGLGLTINDFKNVFKKPKAFWLGFVNQMIILPIAGLFVIYVFSLKDEIAVGMMILACCPGGVTSNILTKLAKGDTALSISFTAVASIITVITLPIVLGFSMKLLGSESQDINILSTGLKMFVLTAGPVSIGLYVNSRYNKFSKLFSSTANKVSAILFVIIVLVALNKNWSTFVENLSSLGPAIILLITIMLFVGFNSSKLFGLNKKQGITVAIESGIQNATVGVTVGNLIFNPPSELHPDTLEVISQATFSVASLPSALYGILMYLVCLPFVYWLIKKQ